MSLKTQIENDIKDAMRAGETLRRDTLRMVLAGLKNRRIEVGEDLTDDQEMAVLLSAVKSRTDSAEQYEKAGRGELAEKERAEIGVIQGYLPQQMTEDETRDAVKSIVDELGLTSKQELGRVMKELMARHKGQVDGKLAGRLAGELLG